jgi:hypothetical protein
MLCANLFYLLALPSITFTMFLRAYLHHQFAEIFVPIAVGAMLAVTILLGACWQYFKAMDTVYLITNERALIIEPNMVYSLPAVGVLRIRKKPGGFTDFVLSIEDLAGSTNGVKRHIGFFGIRDAENVKRLLLENFKPFFVTDKL